MFGEKNRCTMKKHTTLVLIFLLNYIASASLKTQAIDCKAGLHINGIGPVLMMVDSSRNRIITANALSSSVSVIDTRTHAVQNIPVTKRTLQFLKSEAMTLDHNTGSIYLIAKECFHIIHPDKKSSISIETGKQFESVAVDETSGNVFLVGQESKELGFYHAGDGEFSLLPWVVKKETRKNLNATPPPPRRKVISDHITGQVIAVDGFQSMLYVFDGKTAGLINSRKLNLEAASRWHLAGYNPKNHCLYVVIETKTRHVIQAAKIDVIDGNDTIVELPGYREGQGINYNHSADQIYIPYDNAASIHLVDYKNRGRIEEIAVPTFGNDATAIDEKNNILYNFSWAHGEIDIINLDTRKLKKRITGLGILPHMFSAVFDPKSENIYFLRGATAVNGVFGAAVSVFHPDSEKVEKIRIGWAPVDLIEFDSTSFLVFNNEDQFCRIFANGTHELHQLPFDFPLQAIDNGYGDIYLSYGAHQSYWPTVYIWDAKNGILTIRRKDLSFYDRRIPRQALHMTLDKDNTLYFTQNNWGREPQFIGTLEDPVRLFDVGKRIVLPDTVTRETTQRIIKYDSLTDHLYLLRIGEKDTASSILQIIDPHNKTLLHRQKVGRTATDLVFDEEKIYVANFGSNSVSIIDKTSNAKKEISTDRGPLALLLFENSLAVINHLDNTLQILQNKVKTYPLPVPGYPDNLFKWGKTLLITSHSSDQLTIMRFDPKKERFKICLRESYPFGDTRFNSRNSSFFMNGQYGDALFSLNRIEKDQSGNVWITDFICGKVFILNQK